MGLGVAKVACDVVDHHRGEGCQGELLGVETQGEALLGGVGVTKVLEEVVVCGKAYRQPGVLPPIPSLGRRSEED